MKGIISQILYASKRDALFIGTTLLIICCATVSCFLGSNALVEAQEAKIAYTAGFSRVAVILGFIIFVIFYVKRLFENREIEVILSHALSRTQILISLFVGFTAILATLIVPVFALLLLLKVNIINALLWSASVFCEGLIVLVFSLCCSLMIRSQVYSLVIGFLFYLIGRSIGTFVAYLTLSAQATIYDIGCSILKVISVCIPRLDLFGKTSWLLYGDYTVSSVGLFVAQTIIFCGLFLCAAIVDFKKKEF